MIFGPHIQMENGQSTGFDFHAFGMNSQRDTSTLEREHGVFHRGQRDAQFSHLLAFDLLSLIADEVAVIESSFQKLELHFLFGLNVVTFLFATDDAEQGWLRKVDVSTCNQLIHLPIEEAQQ